MGPRDKMMLEPNPDGRMEFSRVTEYEGGL